MLNISQYNILSPKEKHRHSLISLVVAGILAFLLGLVFWYVSSDKVVREPVDNSMSLQEKQRAEVAAMLENAKSNATNADINRVANVLQGSKSKVTDADRDKVSSVLENI